MAANTDKKIMIASDIHGSGFWCGKLTEAFEEEKPEKLLLLGDILYHGPRNELPDGYSPKRGAELLNPLKTRILCVRGNCDSEVDELVLEFPIGAEYCVLPYAGRRLFLTHGHKTPKHLKKGDVLFNGHFHVPAFEEREDCTYVNCGSVSIPKENSPHSYLVLEEGVLVWKDVETGKEFMRAAL